MSSYDTDWFEGLYAFAVPAISWRGLGPSAKGASDSGLGTTEMAKQSSVTVRPYRAQRATLPADLLNQVGAAGVPCRFFFRLRRPGQRRQFSLSLRPDEEADLIEF